MNSHAFPKIVGFYAYKGGTGRSLCAAHTAWALAREGRRVVVVDMDLSAPSQWALFGRTPAPGLVEYVSNWGRRRPLPAGDLVEEIPLDSKASGALYLLQSGRLDKPYLESLQTLDWQELVELPPLGGRERRDVLFSLSTPFEDLFAEITEAVQPEAILIDAPTGFSDTSSLVLRSLADLVIAIFAPMKVQLEGIARVVSLLTAEQIARSRKGENPKPDVFCVASTIFLSRLVGSQVRRIGNAFRFLDQVRYDALGSPEEIDEEVQDRSHQDAAVISFDESLADLESLPTSEEPSSRQFVAFDDVISYVRDSLPPPVPKNSLVPSEKKGILDELCPRFELFAEQDAKLKSLFLRTRHVEELREPRVVLVLGGKGSGKSALFSYATAQENMMAVHGPGVGLGADLLSSIQDAIPSLDPFWRVYALSAVPSHNVVSDADIRAAAALIPRLRAEPLLKDGLVRFLRLEDIELRLLNAWRELDRHLAEQRSQVILCLDGLDVAFKADTKRRERGLVDLFTAWQSAFSAQPNISLKIFLRADLWQSLSFPEKSHLRSREMKLTWEDRNLWRLVVKRAIDSPRFEEWLNRSPVMPALTPGAVETAGEPALHPYLDRLFDRHIWKGKNSLSRNWLLRRLADARGVIYPRDLICLLREALGNEANRIGEGSRVSEDSVVSRQSLSEALAPTSIQRVDALREEYPELVGALERMRGMDAAGRIDNLKSNVGDNDLNLLSEAGVVKLKEEGDYVVPDLYRHGLEMPRKGPL